jgi:hypothetical protein
MDFLHRFEGFLETTEEIAEFRQSLSYVELMKRWQFNVYFHLR